MRGRPFEPGNNFGTGRPKGSRNKTRVSVEQILLQHAEGLMKKCIVLALQGERNALKLCMERLMPVRREGFVSLPALRTQTSLDVAESCDHLLRAISRGRLTPAEGKQLAEILEGRRRVIETTEILGRVEELEAFVAEKKN